MQDTPTNPGSPQPEPATQTAPETVRRPCTSLPTATVGIGLVCGAILGILAVLLAPRETSFRARPSTPSTAPSRPNARSEAPGSGVLAPPGLPTSLGAGSAASPFAREPRRSPSTPRPADAHGFLVRVPAGETLARAGLPQSSTAREVFKADDGARYFAFASGDPASVEARLPEGWSVFADGEGSLQAATNPDNARTYAAASPQRAMDPSVPLQWHNFAWPSLLLDRFPVTLDQNVAGLRARRIDEFVFWHPDPESGMPGTPGTPGTRAEDLAPSCPGHQPATLQVNRLWNAFEDDDAGGGEVYLLDGPVDATHADLEGRVDILGHSGDASGATSGFGGSRNATTNANKALGTVPDDLLATHGTHVAGVIAARRNDHGVTGVAPGVRLRVLPLSPTTRGGTTVRLSDALAGLSTLAVHLASTRRPSGTAIVSLGWSFEEDVGHLTMRGSPLRDAFESLLRNDVIVVVPAGNTVLPTKQGPALPAALAPFLGSSRGVLLPVSATGLCSDKAWFSRIAPLASGVMLFAPGERIFATFPAGDYGALSGTSQAAAQVAGVLAVAARAAPSVNARGLVEALLRTSQPLPQLSSRALMPDAWGLFQEVSALQSKVR